MMGGAGFKLDPLVAANDSSKPLLSKLLAVPALKQRYLGYVRDIADKWLDWSKLGPMAEKNFALISESVKIDTRKLDSYDGFKRTTADDRARAGTSRGPEGTAPGPPSPPPLCHPGRWGHASRQDLRMARPRAKG